MVIANILGIFILFYFFWKRLKDDYQYEKIFNLAFIVLFGYLIGYFTSRYLDQNFWFWIQLAGIMLGFTFGIKRLKMKFFETFEALVIGTLPWVSMVFLSDSINKSSLSSFLAFWVTSICIFVFFFVSARYRTFTWYKSGRVGFAGLVALQLFFVFRLVASIFFQNVISLSGKFEVYLSASVLLIVFLLIYSLSRSDE